MVIHSVYLFYHSTEKIQQNIEHEISKIRYYLPTYMMYSEYTDSRRGGIVM